MELEGKCVTNVSTRRALLAGIQRGSGTRLINEEKRRKKKALFGALFLSSAVLVCSLRIAE